MSQTRIINNNGSMVPSVRYINSANSAKQIHNAAYIYAENFLGTINSQWPSTWTPDPTAGSAIGSPTPLTNWIYQHDGWGRISPGSWGYSGQGIILSSVDPINDCEFSGIFKPIDGNNVAEDYIYFGINGDAWDNVDAWRPKNGHYIAIYWGDPSYGDEYPASFFAGTSTNDNDSPLMLTGPEADHTSVAANEHYFRLQRIGSTMRFKFWQISSEEPTLWSVETTIPGTPHSGRPWITASSAGGYPYGQVDFRNLIFRAL